MSVKTSTATSVNKLAEALLGENFTGDLLVNLKKNQLKLASGSTNVSASTDGVIYQLAEKPVAVLKDGNYLFKMSDGYLSDVTEVASAAEAAAPAKPLKKAVGGQSPAPRKRVFD